MQESNFEKISVQKNKEILREKFKRGEIPFEYSYNFPNGEKLEAIQDKEGLAKLIIKRGDEIIFDAQDFLPDYKFITPTYCNKYPEKSFFLEVVVPGEWGVSQAGKTILVGLSDSPKIILSLLHEIGHVKNNKPEDEERAEGLYRRLTLMPTGSKATIFRKEEAKVISKMEREAWAWALINLRKIARETKIDLKNFFSDNNELKSYIYEQLSNYREYYHHLIMENELDPDFQKDLEKLFDKYRY